MCSFCSWKIIAWGDNGKATKWKCSECGAETEKGNQQYVVETGTWFKATSRRPVPQKSPGASTQNRRDGRFRSDDRSCYS